MIDTIKFLIPLTDIELIKQLQGSLMRLSKENLKTGKVEFEFYTASAELGSYHRKVAIKSTEVPMGFFVEFSVPKYERGNNVEMIYPHNLPMIIEKLYKELCAFMNYNLPHYSKWPIYKLDVSYNWIFKNKEEAEYALGFISRIDYPRKKKYLYDTSVMYTGTAYTIKFYLKGEEFRKNDFKEVSTDHAPQLQAWANKILRFEVALKKTQLKQQFLSEQVFIDVVANDWEIEEILKSYLDKVFFYLNTETTTNERVIEKLHQRFTKSKATRLYQFYRGYYFDENIKSLFLQGGLDRSTIYRNKKDLKRAGIGIASTEIPEGISIFEQLIIPSKNSRYILVDYLP